MDIWIIGGISFSTLGMTYLGLQMSLDRPTKDKLKRRYKATFLGLAAIVLCLNVWQGMRAMPPSLKLLYHGQPLDKQTVTLARSCIPASSIQPDMYIDNNYPDAFFNRRRRNANRQIR